MMDEALHSAAWTLPVQKGPRGVQILQGLTLKAHVWLNDESDACFLDSLCQLVEVLHLQRHAEMRHRHRITVHCKAARGRFQRQCMPKSLSSQMHDDASYPNSFMSALQKRCIYSIKPQQCLR